MLDATTVLTKNFAIVADGAYSSSALVGESADYFPLTNTVRLSISSVYATLDKKFEVAASDLKDIYGNSVDFVNIAYAGKENKTELYDVSVLSVTYLQDDVIRYTCPADGNYTVIVNLVNASPYDRDVALVYYVHDDLGGTNVLLTKELTLPEGQCVSDTFDSSELDGKKVLVRLEK